MSTPTLRKSNSPSSWGVKKCLKVAVGLVALSQFSIAQACSPSTISVSWEQIFNEVCKGKACATQSYMAGGMYLAIRGRYEKWFYYNTANGANMPINIGKHCSPDKVFCIEFYGTGEQATLHYANTQFKLASPNVKEGGFGQGSAEYWHCL
ncbi:hypothetical protein BGW39_004023 [Mortierella sp. 14UC]|nr:hypothetical protein BGW39_004023 [Mortierella sp. 14UC]